MQGPDPPMEEVTCRIDIFLQLNGEAPGENQRKKLGPESYLAPNYLLLPSYPRLIISLTGTYHHTINNLLTLHSFLEHSYIPFVVLQMVTIPQISVAVPLPQ